MPPDNFGLYSAPVSQPWTESFSSATRFFEDIPWSGVPVSRLANFSHRPMYPRGGLLGGSSKLAKLAAARKQREQEEQSAAEQTDAGRSIAILDRLAPKKEKENNKQLTTAFSNIATEKPKSTFPTRLKRAASPVREPEPKKEEGIAPAPTLKPPSELRAQPSIFARTIFGQEAHTTGGASLSQPQPACTVEPRNGGAFTLPFLNDPEYLKRNPFSGPSPDDIVLRAQSKGPAHT
jgi:elongation factor 1 alpha-like protein